MASPGNRRGHRMQARVAWRMRYLDPLLAALEREMFAAFEVMVSRAIARALGVPESVVLELIPPRGTRVNTVAD